MFAHFDRGRRGPGKVHPTIRVAATQILRRTFMTATGRAREWPSIPRRLPDDKKMTHWAVEVQLGQFLGLGFICKADDEKKVKESDRRLISTRSCMR